MLRRRLVPLVALAWAASAGCDGGAASEISVGDQEVPGWRRVPTERGVLLLAETPRPGSATRQLAGGLRELSAAFGGSLVPTSGFADAADREAQATFRAEADGLPVAGLLVSFGAGPGLLAATYDREERLRGSLPDLLSALRSAAPAGEGAGRGAPPVRWTTAPLPDGSGTIRIPADWRVTSAYQGAVDVAGPRGEAMSLGIGYPVATPAAATNPLTGQLMDGLVSPPLDPVTAVQGLFPRVAEFLQRANPAQPGLSGVRVLEASAIPSSVGGPAAFILWEGLVGGRPYRAFSLVDCSPPTSGYWMLYSSTVSAPVEGFGAAFPVMMEAWGGWRVNPAVFRQRLQRAYRTMRETHRLLTEAAETRSRSFDRSLADWTEVFRGSRVVEDTRTGERTDLDIGWVDRQVERLNEAAGYERYRQIPLRDLGW